ncbi:MAG: hypothetical protein QOF67_3967 [Mycobacterium sp.]|nr:hypothetical protein [Mycobacterium sp.]
MTTTTDVVRKQPFWDTYRRRGYLFREVAILTILIGFGMHLYRVIFGDDLTLHYVVTPTSGAQDRAHRLVYPAFLTLFAKLQYRN